MRLLSLNLRHGGGRRLEALGDWLLAQQADLLALQEYRHNAGGARLQARLEAAGYAHRLVTGGAPRQNALLLASRAPMQPWQPRALAFERLRVLGARVAGLDVVSVHLPNLRAKVPHWEGLLRVAQAARRRPAVFVGDFNTGRDGVDAADYRFSCAAHMAALVEEHGWVDAWRYLHPAARDFTWYSHRSNGFRLDHAFLSPPCAPRLQGARLLQEVRTAGLSDHAALLVELAEKAAPAAGPQSEQPGRAGTQR